MNDELEKHRQLAREYLGTQPKIPAKPRKRRHNRYHVPSLGSIIDFNSLFEYAPETVRQEIRSIMVRARKSASERSVRTRNSLEQWRVTRARERARDYLAEISLVHDEEH